MERDLKIFTENIEEEAVEQINELLEQDVFAGSKVRIMPDVHAGKGCVIGFTGDLGDKVIPNIVGVDIGCGMLCVKLGKIDIDLEKLDRVIRRHVPSGRNVHEGVYDQRLIKMIQLDKLHCYNKLRERSWLSRSLGTLGGGNHFIEIDKDDEGNLYLIIHTGSRNLGKQVAEYYQKLAVSNCSYGDLIKAEKQACIAMLKEEGRQREITAELARIDMKYLDAAMLPKDLCYLDGAYRDLYLHDMRICQIFAKHNRNTIAGIILHYMGLPELRFFEHFETVHNYISFEDNIIRKGAISAKKDEIVLIPMNMRDGCIIAKGKGNEDWNCSAPHGAGRIMSRHKAKESLSIEEYKESMDGIFTTSINEDTLDEAPMVYKPMEEIIDCIGDTVDIIKIIKPIYNFKASE